MTKLIFQPKAAKPNTNLTAIMAMWNSWNADLTLPRRNIVRRFAQYLEFYLYCFFFSIVSAGKVGSYKSVFITKL